MFPSMQLPPWSEATLDEWVSTGPSYREERRFLEEHLELIDPRSIASLEEALDFGFDDPEAYEILGRCIETLYELLERDLARDEAIIFAIRECYVNQHGGFALNLPSWLESVETRMAEWSSRHSPEATAQARVRILRAALERARNEPGIAAEIQAELAVQLWDALSNLADRNKMARYEEGFVLLQAALESYTKARFPHQYAIVQGTLGSIYADRDAGDIADNLERSIAAYLIALECAPREAAPVLWASLQQGLAEAYQKRILSDPDDNARRGIACCEAALDLFTEQDWPEQWAKTMNTLGNLSQKRLTGGRRENVERAIDCYQAALRAVSLEAYPTVFAMIQNNLGQAFANRIASDPVANVELAIAAYAEAHKVFKKDTHPLEYAMVLYNRAAVALNRPVLSLKQNIASAIQDSREALQIYTLAEHPLQYAAVQSNLGVIYSRVFTFAEYPLRYATRVSADESAQGHQPDEKDQAIEHAIAAHNEALKVYTPHHFPADYARTMQNLGITYCLRRQGSRSRNLDMARHCFEAAGRICTPGVFPADARLLLLNQLLLEEDQQNWPAVHELCEKAYELEKRLLQQEIEEDGRAALLREGRDTTLRDGYALARLGRFADSAVAIERGRARGLAEWLTVETADTRRIRDSARRRRFEEARERLVMAQAALYAPLRTAHGPDAYLQEWEKPADKIPLRQVEAERATTYQQARVFFDATVAEIRAANDPGDFLEDVFDADTILRAAAGLGSGHAIVYLAATYWGGMAVGAFSAATAPDSSTRTAHFAALDLPRLTLKQVADIAMSRINDDAVTTIGGFTYAQRGFGLIGLKLPTWQGDTLRQRARSLEEACRSAGKSSMLSEAAQLALQIPAVALIADRPLQSLSDREQSDLDATINYLYLRLEIRSSLEKLGEMAMRPLYSWARQEGATSITLIPCGFLESFPLTAVSVEEGHTFADLLPASIAPNARALLREPQEGTATVRAGVFTLGDPWPSHQVLRWGEAEALTVAQLARKRGLHGEARVQQRATRQWLVRALNSGRVVCASCHGMFDELDFLRSRLLLANGESLTLAEALSHQVDAHGLRLFVLSACQTAIPDVRGQTDEVRSLGAAMVQAGAQAVLGSLWPVNDKATYLLIVRFAEEWLCNLDHESPAMALKRAQHWLRTVTNGELATWEAKTFVNPSAAELTEARGDTHWEAPWRIEDRAPVDMDTRIAVRGRGNRYTVSEAEGVQRDLASAARPEECPYADPVYWAAFQIIGW